MKKDIGQNWKLGAFVLIGLIVFVAGIYFVGKQKNLFGSTMHLKAGFKTVSGLKEGNNVRFSGINIGTVSTITLTSDTSVIVEMVIQKDMQQFLKTDCIATIGSDGLMGDKVLTISPGTDSGVLVKDGDFILSRKAVEMEDVMASIQTSVDNAGVITAHLADFTANMNNGSEQVMAGIRSTVDNADKVTGQLAAFSYKMNNDKGLLYSVISDTEMSESLKSTIANLGTVSDEFVSFTAKMNSGKGALSKFVTDEQFGKSIDSTMSNIQSSTKKLDESLEAVQHNFLLRGFFKKKAKAEAKLVTEQKKAADKKAKDDREAIIIPVIQVDSSKARVN